MSIIDPIVARVVAALVLVVSLIAVGGTADAQTASCNGLTATVRGTADDDVLEGTGGRDVFVGFGGNDQILGRGGDDVACGGSGSDQIDGGSGDDVLIGGVGADVLKGLEGNDTLWGQRGDDVMDGGEEFEGQADNDVVSYENATTSVMVDLEEGIARSELTSSGDFGDGDDSLVGLESIIGTDFNDKLYGDGQVNLMLAGNGDDSMTGRGAADKLHGGSGVDRVEYGFTTTPVKINLTRQTIDTSSGDDVITSIEDAVGGQAADRFVGTGGPNGFIGGSGRDVFIGKKGDDYFHGGVGRDTAVYAYAASNVEVRLGSGSAVVGSGDTDKLDLVENVRGTGKADTVYGTRGANEIRGGLGSDRLYGRGGRDALAGQGGHDLLQGHAGADTLVGAAGNDTLQGGDGNDLLNGGADRDICNGGNGTDTLRRCP